MKALYITIFLSGCITLNLLGQKLLYSDTFQQPELWFCTYSYDGSEIAMDTAFCGIRNQSLIVYAQQGGGCARASAWLRLSDTLPEDLEHYELVYWIKRLETVAPLTDNYLLSNIRGSFVHIGLGSFEDSGPFKLSILKKDSVVVKASSRFLEEHPWDAFITHGFKTHEEDAMSSLEFDFSTEGCSADFGHGALVVFDSIQLFEVVADTLTDTTGVRSHALPEYSFRQTTDGCHIVFHHGPKRISAGLYYINGTLIKQVTGVHGEVHFNLNNYPRGMYIVQLQTPEKRTCIKWVHY